MPRPGSSPTCPIAGADTGLERGFTRYQDYFFPGLSAFKPAALVDRPVEGLRTINQILWEYLGLDIFADSLQPFYAGNRKPATAINREFLDWLSSRRQPERPFFAFLNFIDAHYPYKLPDSSISRFGGKPRNEHEKDLIDNWQAWDKVRISARDVAFARDAYDDCIADLDEQLGRLIDELERRGILERTWLIVTSDHGESFGVPHNDFGHGTSLYQPQLHVPLVIVPPAVGRTWRWEPGAAGRPRDGEPPRLAGDGRSTCWIARPVHRSPAPRWPDSGAVPIRAIPPSPQRPGRRRRFPRWSRLTPWSRRRRACSRTDPSGGRWPKGIRSTSGPIIAVTPSRSCSTSTPIPANCSTSPKIAARQPLLERMRATLDRLTAGPLTVQRFRP